MKAIAPRLDILPPAQRDLWVSLAPCRRLGFVLYGGTAIALRLGHRVSVDFDFFSERQLQRAAIQNAIPFLVEATVIQDDRQTIVYRLPGLSGGNDVKISFFGQIRIGRVGSPDITEDGVAQVASLSDLMATKLKVILQRAEAKDYLDVAAMLSASTSLQHGLASAKALFGENFQPSEALKALTFFEDGDLPALSQAVRKLLANSAGQVKTLPDVSVVSKLLSA